MKPVFCKGKEKSDNLSKLISEDLTLDSCVFKDVFEHGFILGNKTPFREIRRKYRTRISEESYLTDTGKIKYLFIKYLRKSIEQAIDKDKKVGLFLSSGIDSTSLAIMLYKYFSKLKVHAYTASFKGNFDEVKKAKEIADKYGFVHRIVKVNINDFDKWTQVIRALGMPIVDEASIPLFKMAQKAYIDGINIILMGDGNDELWCGYDWYYKLKKSKKKMPCYLPHLGRLLKKLNLPKIGTVGELLQYRNLEELIKPKYLFDLKERLPYCWVEQRYGIVKHFGMLPKFPFLTQELVNLAYSVPLDLKLKFSNKWLVKQAIANIDRTILEKEKRLMGFPKIEMFKANKGKIKKLIEDSEFVSYSPLDDYTTIHRKFIIALWYNIFLKNKVNN